MALLAVAAIAATAFVFLRGGSESSAARDALIWDTFDAPDHEPQEQWRFAVEGRIVGAAIDGNRAFVATSEDGPSEDETDLDDLDWDEIEALEEDDGPGSSTVIAIADGEQQWTADVDASVDGGVILYEGVLLASSYEADATYALDPDDGKRMWRAEGAVVGTTRSGSVVLDAGQDEDREVRLVDLDDGKTVWSADGSIEDICDGRVYVYRSTDDSSEVAALAIDDGSEIWSRDGHTIQCEGAVTTMLTDQHLSIVDGAGKDVWQEPLEEGWVTGLSSEVVLIDARMGSGDDGDEDPDSGDDWQVRALAVSDGTELWHATGEAYFAEGPIAGILRGERIHIVEMDDGSEVMDAQGDSAVADAGGGWLIGYEEKLTVFGPGGEVLWKAGPGTDIDEENLIGVEDGAILTEDGGEVALFR